VSNLTVNVLRFLDFSIKEQLSFLQESAVRVIDSIQGETTALYVLVGVGVYYRTITHFEEQWASLYLSVWHMLFVLMMIIVCLFLFAQTVCCFNPQI
jgi:hypothetical protein